MKKRLNITIEENLVDKIKIYADQNNISISSLVKEHFETLVKPNPKLKNGIGLVEYMKSLPKSKLEFPENFDYKKEIYKEHAKKYGFEDIL